MHLPRDFTGLLSHSINNQGSVLVGLGHSQVTAPIVVASFLLLKEKVLHLQQPKRSDFLLMVSILDEILGA